MESLEVRVIETLFNGVPFLGVESEHLGEEIEAEWVCFREKIFEVLFGSFGEGFDVFESSFVGDEAEVLDGGSSEDGDDSLDLFEVVFSGEERGSAEEFGEDAPNAPDIECFGVFGR